jgi:ubiquinone/menaquinone biosynthesis C-methylase UbiE
MSFDRLAPHYRWMEWVLAGSKLQRCRTMFLRTLPPLDHALILGEGTGRFLAELLKVQPQATVTCLDSSAGMLAQAKKTLAKQHLDSSNVRFIHSNIFEWKRPCDKFDLIVTHFFFDCFRPEQIASIVRSINLSLTQEAAWLLADFRIPPSGIAKVRARLIVSAMYFFFRAATRLDAKSLANPDAILEAHRFVLKERVVAEWGLLQSDLWKRE